VRPGQRVWFVAAVLLAGAPAASGESPAAAWQWTSPCRYRIRLTVDPRGGTRSNSPASVELDFQQALAARGAPGEFDADTIEVVGHDASARPRVFDASRPARQRHLLPWRIDRSFGTTRVTLHFVVPDEKSTRYAVYFDTAASGLGQPQRYHGLVGDGDRFCEGFGRREVNASHFDQFCDFDGDGDLDLFKGGVEPFVYCYENVGGNRLVERGRLTSDGELLVLPKNPRSNRSWVTVAFHDWDGDGQQDFLPSFMDGPDAGKIVLYRNVTRQKGRLSFARVGPLRTVSGVPVASGAQAGGWFPSVSFVRDWDRDGDGTTDLLVGSNHRCWLYRNLGPGPDGLPRLADAVAVQAAGKDIVLTNPRFDCADIGGDGNLDLFAGTQPGPIWLFRNIGTRTTPVFDRGTVLAFGGKYLIGDAHSGVKVADFDGDGLLDFVAGRFWERTELSHAEGPRDYGGLYKNVGTPAAPRFERRTAASPYTEQFQICDAVRQNSVRAVDWDDDGKTDLLAGDTDGFIWCFRNRTGNRFPLFAPGEKLQADGKPLSVAASGGHARFDVCDWNNDGKHDLLVADGGGTLNLFVGTGEGSLRCEGRVTAGGKPIQGAGRSSVLVCDFDNDGLADVVFADENGYWWYRNVGTAAAPRLAPAKPILFGGRPVRYARPNLGSFVDWDGDGKRDLIGCEFENSVRLYRNLGSGRPGEEPQFAPPDGEELLRSWVPQMISGADAVDWNGDGRLDLLTGQGHGGSGLRYYQRDYLDDELHRSHPIVTALGLETNP